MPSEFNCCDFCPVKRDCRLAQGVWADTNRFLGEEAVFLAGAIEQGSLAEIYGAMAIGTGEITIEEYEKLERATGAPRTREIVSKRLESLPREQTLADEFKEAIDSVAATYEEVNEQCSGLKLTKTGTILEAISKALYLARTAALTGKRREVLKDLYTDRREHDKTIHYLKYGRCGSAAVRSALKKSGIIKSGVLDT